MAASSSASRCRSSNGKPITQRAQAVLRATQAVEGSRVLLLQRVGRGLRGGRRGRRGAMPLRAPVPGKLPLGAGPVGMRTRMPPVRTGAASRGAPRRTGADVLTLGTKSCARPE